MKTQNPLLEKTAPQRLHLESAIRASQRVNLLTDDDVTLLQRYCKWRKRKSACDDLNKLIAGSGLPKHRPPMFIKENEAEALFNAVLTDISRNTGHVILASVQIDAVREAVRSRQDKKTKPTGVQFSSIRKFVSDGRRVIRGIASSSRVDRVGDIVDARSGHWQTPLPLLFQHNHSLPIGSVRTVEARGDEVWIECEIATGVTKADEVWTLVQQGALDSFSIGFSAKDWAPLPDGGKLFRNWELMEISIVSVPANPAAKIRRSHDEPKNILPRGSVKLISAPKHHGVAVTRRAPVLLNIGGTK